MKLLSVVNDREVLTVYALDMYGAINGYVKDPACIAWRFMELEDVTNN